MSGCFAPCLLFTGQVPLVMRIDTTLLPPSISEIEKEGRVAESARRARPGPVVAAAETGTVEMPALPSSAAVPWMDPGLGGRMALGSSDQYLPVLQSLYEDLSRRDDSVARFGSAAIMEELHNHSVLSGQLNSLIA